MDVHPVLFGVGVAICAFARQGHVIWYRSFWSDLWAWDRHSLSHECGVGVLSADLLCIFCLFLFEITFSWRAVSGDLLRSAGGIDLSGADRRGWGFQAQFPGFCKSAAGHVHPDDPLL